MRCFNSEPLNFALAPIFEGMVNVWLDETALKTRQWADQALAVDTVSLAKSETWSSQVCSAGLIMYQFEPTTENGPSSSVTDLFDSFRSASNFLMDLRWSDEEQLAAFATRLAKVRRTQNPITTILLIW
jgi:hypothetical protein